MIRALVFDFDGTLLDTETPEFEAWQALYREHGLELDLVRWQEGIGTWDVFDPYAGLPDLSREAVTQRIRYQVQLTLDEQDLRPGAREVLEEAAASGYRLAVASSSGRAWVEGWLRRHGLFDRFETVATRDDVTRVKPDPELYLLAARTLGLAPAECLAVEDSLNGATAAERAGMHLVVVTNPMTCTQPFPPAWKVLGGFEGGLRRLLP